MARRFPPPWRVVEIPAGWKVQDASGADIGWFYCRDHPNLEAGGGDPLTRDQARRMAVNFAKLPELLSDRGRAG